MKKRQKEVPLSDQTHVQGIPWSALKHNMADEAWEVKSFYEKLTFEEKKLIEDLDDAQYAQGDMKPLKTIKR